MIEIINHTEIPTIIHLQGLLGPCANAFWPVDYNSYSFLWPFSFREWIIRNGYRYEKNRLAIRGNKEERILKNITNVMGRTSWDKSVVKFLSPNCCYFHVNEVLRKTFYIHAGEWKPSNNRTFIIISTISDTMYKGFDVIMKTSKLLKKNTDIDFKWHIVGINKKTRIVNFFEHKLGFSSESVGIEFKGVLSESKLCQALLDASLYVHPSYIDNSPNSVCEAQILGLPVIATNVGGVSSLIDNGKDGFLVPANAPYEIAALVSELNACPQLAEEISHNAVLTASSRHSKAAIIESLLSSYSSLL